MQSLKSNAHASSYIQRQHLLRLSSFIVIKLAQYSLHHRLTHRSTLPVPSLQSALVHPPRCLSRTVSFPKGLSLTLPITACTHSFLHFLRLTDAYPASAAFDVIHNSLTADKKEQQAAIKEGAAIIAFTLKNAKGETESWHIDLKEKGEVGKGVAPEGKKADG